MRLLRWILIPLTLLYAGVIWLRNRLYDWGWLKSQSFDLPVVVIGNLAVGGTGKSPMTEYILRQVKDTVNIAVLSRGYGRKTKGFRYVMPNDQASLTGDEPLQIKRKFPQVTVAVAEDRCLGVNTLQTQHDAILLDDAFQHRRLKPSFAILLFDYQSLLEPIMPLPTGNFRDLMPESRRAQVIVITKCPNSINLAEAENIKNKLLKYSSAPVFFSRIRYSQVQSDRHSLNTEDLKTMDILLLTGIANPKPLSAYLQPLCKNISHLRYADHHSFTQADLSHIAKSYTAIAGAEKCILTTEKDYQRLPAAFLAEYPVIYIPIVQEILFNEKDIFDLLIKQACIKPTA